MKKIFILFIVIIVATATTNAQVFIEGGVDVSHLHSSDTDVSSSSFSIYPSIGYWLNNKVAIGITPEFIGENHNGKSSSTSLESAERRRRTWSIAVFGRYKLLEKEKFSILIETPVGYGISTYKITGESPDIDSSSSTFHVSAFPFVSYKLSERFDIIARCSFFSLNFSSVTNKNEETNEKGIINQINFGASSSVFNSLGNISIGFVYNFKSKS